MARAFPEWRGFERAPAGKLLSQVVDLSGPMGIAYERSVGFHKAFHVHDRLMIVCPRGATSMRVVEQAPRRPFTVGGNTIILVPKECVHADEGASVVYDTLALFPEDALVNASARAAGLSSRALAAVLSGPILLRRSRWLDEALERYFTARVLDRAPRSERLAFLEHEIVVEALGSSSPVPKRNGEVARADDPIFERAVRAIEANLFATLDLDWLGGRVGASTSTLLRAFRREIAQTPYAYVKGRRLDEAKRLLEGGGVQVKEVALLVGYEEVSSFSRAFRARFGAPPLEFLPRPRPRGARRRAIRGA